MEHLLQNLRVSARGLRRTPGFAIAAVSLAAVGLFGVMATMVRLRTRELGVRMALGATAADIGRLVLRGGMALAATGTALGLIGALATNRLASALAFDVAPTDPMTLGVVAMLLLAVGALASLIPARSGARIAPAVALRAEGGRLDTPCPGSSVASISSREPDHERCFCRGPSMSATSLASFSATCG